MSLINENSPNHSDSYSNEFDNSNNESNIIPSPQLKEIDTSKFSHSQLTNFYHQTVYILYLLYHLCHLVHGDMSEYNLLLNHSTEIFLIDFGQSVDISHPTAYEYLLRDIRTINEYFLRCGVSILSNEQIMSLITQERNSAGEGSNDNELEQERSVINEKNENSHLYFEENKSKKVLKCNCHSTLKFPRQEFYELLQNM